MVRIDPNKNQCEKIISYYDTHKVSMFDWYYKVDTYHVGSLIPLLIVCIQPFIHIYTSPIGLDHP